MEIWKPVKDYEGLYEVSNLGNVKSLNYRQTKKPKILLPGGDRYYMVVLSKNGKRKAFTIHKLMAIAFLGHKKECKKLVVDHINNKPFDNRIENLQLITTRENSSKDRKGGTSKYTGVCWSKLNKKWSVHIRIGTKYKFVGLFDDEYQAHLAYQEKLKQIEI